MDKKHAMQLLAALTVIGLIILLIVYFAKKDD